MVFEVKNMVLGEKLWEGKGKTMSTTIKAATAEGVVLEYTWMAQLKGLGKAKGVDANVTFSAVVMMGPSGAGASQGQGLLMTMTGDMAVVKGSGYGKNEAGKSKGVGIWSFMTMSQKLAWMNNVVAIATMEGDPQWMEFDITINEWK
jgi:hypothetical protein